MGYAGLSISGSDLAANMTNEILENLVSYLQKQCKEKANRYNTDGVVNVAMFFEELISPNAVAWASLDVQGGLSELAKKVSVELQNSIKFSGKQYAKKWDNEENRIMHNTRYREMKQALNKFVKIREKFWA